MKDLGKGVLAFVLGIGTLVWIAAIIGLLIRVARWVAGI